MEDTTAAPKPAAEFGIGRKPRILGGKSWLIAFLAAVVFGLNIVSPPHLMDDVDAVQAQIARNMLTSGDWVTARLDGVSYLEKSPLIYWMIASSYRIFGVHDWSARIPLALCTILLCCIAYRFACWAFGEETGIYAGVILATCIGLYLFTRILIPDCIVTLTITLSIWSWLRLLDPDEKSPWSASAMLGIALGLGLLLKGLIAIAFPLAACGLFMVISREAFSLHAWKKLHLLFAACLCIVIAAPWHVLATLRNPPWFAFSMHSGPGEYRGFFWFYFLNEHLLRFLNLRYPRDYNTVPRIWFWLLNLVWLFPWSVYLPGAFKLTYLGPTRAARVRLMALCWIAVVMVFFTFSTTQEYYSMPIYPALALLLACSLRDEGIFNQTSSLLLAALTAFIGTTLAVLLLMVWRLPAPGDIVQALNQHPELYTLSLGHMGDLTLRSFAYLRLPLFLAALCCGLCAIGIFFFRASVQKTVALVSICMAFFFQAARLALVRFDSYLSSYPLAKALQQAPPGELIEMDGYYAFSSVFFYADRRALLLHGRINNLEYGSNAPEAPHVFIDDQQFEKLWHGSKRCYLLTYAAEAPKLQSVGGTFILVTENSGAELFTNLAMP